MIGHFAGTIAQFGSYYICSNYEILNKPTCNFLSIILHEFVVEPLTNSYIVNFIYQQFSDNQNSESSEKHHNCEHHSHSEIGNIVSGAVFAIMFSYVTNYVLDISHNHHDHHHHSHSHIPEAIMSLTGSIAGQALFSYYVGGDNH